MGAFQLSQREALLFALFAVPAFINFFMYLENADKVILDMTTHITDSVLLLESSLLHLDPTDEPTVSSIAPEVSIRNWGCDLMETPLIFVHIGKSGGGTVRARLAASALNYTRSAAAWPSDNQDNSYYPVGPDNRGFFCDKGHPQFRVTPNQGQEKVLFCHAMTPLGQSIACPEPLNWTNRQCKRCDPLSEHCPVVYTGHNYLGNELHWLPQKYLSNWWKKSWMTDDMDSTLKEDQITPLLETLQPENKEWCPLGERLPRPQNLADYEQKYAECSGRLIQLADKEAFHAVQCRPKFMASQPAVMKHPFDIDWSPLYASMPVLRVTVIRDPYSWMVSKFMWHKVGGRTTACDDIEAATMFKPSTEEDIIPGKKKGRGWVNRMAMSYITYLCGEDCVAREALEVGSLEQFERQAANNLRRSITVVGLLNETDKFFDMITARVGYVNLTLNPHVKGSKHPSVKNEEAKRCKALFQEPSFQAKLRERSPALAALDRLYHVAVEVNRHQLNELRQCADPSLKL